MSMKTSVLICDMHVLMCLVLEINLYGWFFPLLKQEGFFFVTNTISVESGIVKPNQTMSFSMEHGHERGNTVK